jgi:hypothetical protein
VFGPSWAPSDWRRPGRPLANAPAKTCSAIKPRQHGVPDGEHCHFLILSPAPDGRRHTPAGESEAVRAAPATPCGGSRSRTSTGRISALARAGDHHFASLNHRALGPQPALSRGAGARPLAPASFLTACPQSCPQRLFVLPQKVRVCREKASTATGIRTRVSAVRGSLSLPVRSRNCRICRIIRSPVRRLGTQIQGAMYAFGTHERPERHASGWDRLALGFAAIHISTRTVP